MPFGFDEKDGKLIVNQAQANVIAFISETFLRYIKHIPEDLVNEVLAEAEAKEAPMSYQEAADNVDVMRLYKRIWEQIQANAVFVDTIAEYNKTASNPILSAIDIIGFDGRSFLSAECQERTDPLTLERIYLEGLLCKANNTDTKHLDNNSELYRKRKRILEDYVKSRQLKSCNDILDRRPNH